MSQSSGSSPVESLRRRQLLWVPSYRDSGWRHLTPVLYDCIAARYGFAEPPLQCLQIGDVRGKAAGRPGCPVGVAEPQAEPVGQGLLVGGGGCPGLPHLVVGRPERHGASGSAPATPTPPWPPAPTPNAHSREPARSSSCTRPGGRPRLGPAPATALLADPPPRAHPLARVARGSAGVAGRAHDPVPGAG